VFLKGSAVTQQPVNHKNDGSCGEADCLVCKDMVRNLERFVDMLQRTRIHAAQWLTVDDVAAELKLSKSIVYRIIRNGEMTAINVVETAGRMAQKGHYRVKREWLDKYVDQKTVIKTPQHQDRAIRSRKLPQVKNYIGL
jgi:excisionase family DNA binding protein